MLRSMFLSFEFYDFRKDGKRRSEKKQTNLLTRLMQKSYLRLEKKKNKKYTRAARKTRVRKLQEAWNEDQRSDAVMNRSEIESNLKSKLSKNI